jgi:nucleoside-triphosphatase
LARHLFITGRPGVGKSTVIRKVADRLGKQAEGFYTEELRVRGKRQGFKVSDLSGREGVLAHVRIKAGPRVGKYGVDVKAFEKVALPAMERAIRQGKIMVVDEIGKMELYSKEFRQKLIEALEGAGRILGVIRQKHDPFTDRIKKMKDVQIITVSEKNRDQLPDLIILKLEDS